MTKRERFILTGFSILFALLILVPKLIAQLQVPNSAGTSVTVVAAIPAGSNLIGKTGIDQTTPGTTNKVSIGTDGTVTINAIPAGNNNIGDVDIVSLPALAAGTNTIGVTIPKTPCGTTVANQDLAALPTSATTVFSSTTCLMRAYFNNTNSGSATITITDNAGSPINGIGPAFSLGGLSNMVIPYDGVRFASGVKWTASGTGVTGAMWGFQ